MGGISEATLAKNVGSSNEGDSACEVTILALMSTTLPSRSHEESIFRGCTRATSCPSLGLLLLLYSRFRRLDGPRVNINDLRPGLHKGHQLSQSRSSTSALQ